MAINAERNLRLFRELITCTHNLYFWTYDTRYNLASTNCPEADILGILFLSIADRIPDEENKPMLLTSPLGFSWAIQLERDGFGLPLYYHVVGPAITSQVDIRTIRETIFSRLNASNTILKTTDELLSHIPSVPVPRLAEYCLMLHYCITEEKLNISDISYPEAETILPKEKEGETVNPYGTWQMEQKLLKLVEDGNLNFRQESTRLIGGIMPAEIGNGNAKRHYKNLVIAFIAMCARAAIRGGLSPEIAYLLSDKYIRGVEECIRMAELAELNDTMQEDFIRRVHEVRTGCYSPQIQHACDYIQIHLEDPLTLTIVSDATGYSPSWLSSKFKKETGKSLTQYILEKRVDYAKEQLHTSNLTIQEIADLLQFKSPSHFSCVFRQQTAMTPSEFRMNGHKQISSSSVPS